MTKTKDRAHWRMMEDVELIEAARHSSDELTIALGDRLDDLRDLPDQLEEAQAGLEDAEKTIDYLRAELRETEAQLTALQAILDAYAGDD